MSTDDDDAAALEALEREGWDALVAGGSTAREFYDRVLDGSALMLLPGGLLLDDRAVILQSMGDSPWSRAELSDVRVSLPGTDVGAVSYVAEAHRGDAVYTALMTSLYARRDGEWRMVLHQQTPDDRASSPGRD